MVSLNSKGINVRDLSTKIYFGYFEFCMLYLEESLVLSLNISHIYLYKYFLYKNEPILCPLIVSYMLFTFEDNNKIT